MTIDLHTHGKLAKKLPFSKEYTKWMFEEAIHAGLDAIALTEHFNTCEFGPLYKMLQTMLFREKDCFLYRGLRIFPGIEIDIAEVGHVVAIGEIEAITQLHECLQKNSSKGRFLSAGELLPLLRQYPVLIGAAHPFREGGGIPALPEELLRAFDYIELNGKDCALHGESTKKQTYSLAKGLGLPIAAGSDTHQGLQFGCVCNQMNEECATVEQLRGLLKWGAYEILIADSCEQQVRSAGLLKRTLKEIDALGGDYMAALTGVRE